MSRQIQLTDTVEQYLLDHSLREPEILRGLRDETAAMPNANMQISPLQGQFMQLLVELTGAKKCLEVGTFTGYSSLAVARALPDDGTLIACDVSEEFTNIARRYWQQAGVADKIELRLGPAVKTLDRLIADGHAGTFDLAFVDADKTNYDRYYEQALTLLKTGGLILIDNTLWSGRIADETAQDADTRALRQLNDKIHHDERVTLSLLPVGDGLTLARKR